MRLGETIAGRVAEARKETQLSTAYVGGAERCAAICLDEHL